MDLSMNQYNFQASSSTHDLVVQQLYVKLKGTEAFSVALRPPQTSWVYCGKRRCACFPWIGWRDCARVMVQGLTWISKQEDWNYPTGSGNGAEYCELQCKDSQPANLYQKEDCTQNHFSKYLEQEGKDYEYV